MRSYESVIVFMWWDYKVISKMDWWDESDGKCLDAENELNPKTNPQRGKLEVKDRA